jgi:TRAP-type uncharacterized transport system fused permease subunit
VAAYAGAAIAGSDPWKTGWTAFKFAKLLYVMPLLFAYTPQILFEGKPLTAPPMQDEIMGAMITEIAIAPGDEVSRGQAIATVLDGDEIREITANRSGIVKEVMVTGGAFLEGGVVIAETRPRGLNVISSIWSAILGTIAFSALTMGYLIRKTNLLEWVALAAATLLLYWPTLTTDLLGLVIVAIIWLSQRARNRRDQGLAAAPA